MDSEVQESMKADIDQLKTQMGQMFEMMVALKDAGYCPQRRGSIFTAPFTSTR